MEKSNYYVFEHESSKLARIKGDKISEGLNGFLKIHEIGSLNGRKGNFNIAGILYKANDKYFMQDKFNSVHVDFKKCKDCLGFA